MNRIGIDRVDDSTGGSDWDRVGVTVDVSAPEHVAVSGLIVTIAQPLSLCVRDHHVAPGVRPEVAKAKDGSTDETRQDE